MRGTAFLPLALLALVILALAGCDRREANPPAQGEAITVAVAAAADLRFALDEIVAAFESAHPNIKVQVTYGSSGNFYSQLSQRAPFDLFLSADARYPLRLVESGLALAQSQFVYGVGRIVVWFPTNSPIDPGSLGIQSLLQPSVRRIAIANPEHAPYGRAALEALKSLGVYDQVKDRLVNGENVAQAAQFVESGAADAGIIALSLALGPKMKDKGRWWEIPATAYPRMEQGGVILNRAAHPEATRELRAFILGPTGKSVLRRYGFVVPDE